MLQRFIVSYDIADPKRRLRAARLLLDHGERVQESVFELLLRPAEWTALCRALDTLIDPDADQWRAWPVCAADHADALDLGQPSPHPADTPIVI